MIIRRATEDDLEAVLDVLTEVAAEGRWIGTELPIDREARLARWRTTLFETNGGVTFVAEMDGKIVGSAGLTGDASPCGTGVLDLGLSILSEHRGQGIGAALTQACIDWARGAGAHKIALQVWPHNEPARALYRKFGFEEEGYLKSHWRRRSGELWDAVIMGLLLDDPSGDS